MSKEDGWIVVVCIAAVIITGIIGLCVWRSNDIEREIQIEHIKAGHVKIHRAVNNGNVSVYEDWVDSKTYQPVEVSK